VGFVTASRARLAAALLTLQSGRTDLARQLLEAILAALPPDAGPSPADTSRYAKPKRTPVQIRRDHILVRTESPGPGEAA
jgi:hypothetical protein